MGSGFAGSLAELRLVDLADIMPRVGRPYTCDATNYVVGTTCIVTTELVASEDNPQKVQCAHLTKEAQTKNACRSCKKSLQLPFHCRAAVPPVVLARLSVSRQPVSVHQSMD